MMRHASEIQLQRFVAGDLDDPDHAWVAHHVESCTVCARYIAAHQRLDGLLRRVETDRAPSSVVHGVMRRLGNHEEPSLLWTFLKNFAPMLGLAVVFGGVYVVLEWLGIARDVGTSSSPGSFPDQFLPGLRTGLSWLTLWLDRYLSFAFAKTEGGMTFLLSMLLAVVALLDRFLLMPRFRRKI